MQIADRKPKNIQKTNRSLVLQLDGGFEARGEDGSEVAGLSRRGQALLAYLSQQKGMRAERGLLVDLLWSDRGEEQARASLRQELSLLRKALPKGILTATRQRVCLDPDQVEIKTLGHIEKNLKDMYTVRIDLKS